MAATTHNLKKVVVRRRAGGVAWGYLPQSAFCHDGRVEMMLVDGKIDSFALSDIEMISYVRDFNVDDPVDPERMGRRGFLGRPRGEGLWLRLGFLEGESLEGLAVFDLGMAEAIAEDKGISLTPPDLRGNTLRVFVPCSALRSLEVLGYITSPSKKVETKKKPQVGQGDLLFEE